MITKTNRFRAASMIALVAQIFAAMPARAADDTASTGVLAALGLDAASGDTKLGDHGGEIEGWLLATSYLDTVAGQILADAGGKIGGRTVVVLTRDEAFSLGQAGALDRRIALLKGKLNTVIAGKPTCLVPVKGAPAAAGGDAALRAAAVPTLADLAGALRTDTNIAGFDIALQDRTLISAIGRWNLVNKANFALVIPSDMSAIPVGTGIIERWDALAEAAAKLASCKDDNGAKPLLVQFAALDAYANAPGDKGAPSPLENAAAMGALVAGNPLLLRVALEKAGGTTITRSNIFLKLGFPGAVVLSGGVVASYRLIDPSQGKLEAAGLVKCAFVPININKIHQYMNSTTNEKEISCN